MTDDPKIWAALITAGFSLLGTLYVAVFNYLGRKEQDEFKAKTDKDLMKLSSALQVERDKRLEEQETEKIVSKYRDPMLHATYDLQSRIYNILKQSFLPVFYTKGTDREKEYSIENTVFLFAQFLGWTELIRQEIQFIDLESDEDTRKLRSLQDGLYSEFQTDRYGKGFRLFAGEQRAVGELMVNWDGEFPRCIGFASFIKDRNYSIDHWLDPLREDIKNMANGIRPYEQRLINIQHGLIDLLEFLDPNYIYFPENKRAKI